MYRLFKSIRYIRPLKILFICSGNIIRSPIAEMLFECLLDRNYEDKWREEIVISSGAVHFKNSNIFPMTKKVLIAEGIPESRIVKFKPRNVTDHPNLFAEADIIFVMTEGQTKRLLKHESSYKKSKTTYRSNR